MSVFEINKKRTFTIKEAREILPLVIRITQKTAAKVNSALEKSDMPINGEVDLHVAEWRSKIEKLGCEAKGLWTVDFDCGIGYYCWKYPEKVLTHFHSYGGGLRDRVKML